MTFAFTIFRFEAVSRSPGAETATKKGFSLTVAILSIPWKI